MKRKVRIKTIPLLVAILVLIPLLTIIFFREESLSKQNDYVTEDTINDSIPVINTTKKIINPYIDSSVKIGKTYYDYKGESQSQENSITVHDNTYIQNSGIDFTSDNQFDVISILEGTVISVKEDNLIGKTIEIKHDNGIISSYQSLSEVNVKKDDYINIVQDLSAVTAACFMVRKQLYIDMLGFDEKLAVAFNDVDFCMKIRTAKYLIVYNPFVEAYHYESKSRGLEDTPEKQLRFSKEVKCFRRKWDRELLKGDPYYSPNLSLKEGDCSLRKEERNGEYHA